MLSRKSALITAWLLYWIGSLVHFIHNAEYFGDDPNLPEFWTKNGVYLSWLGMSALGALGLLLALTRFRLCGLVILVLHIICGIDSLGHYFVAYCAEPSVAMNGTILLEVGTALILMAIVVWHLSLHVQNRIVEWNSQ